MVRQIAAGVMANADGAESLIPLVAAVRAGGNEFDLGDLETRLQEKLAGEQAEIEAIKPISFYTWTEELQRIFRQDRALQRPLRPEDARRMAEVIRGDAKLLRDYRRHLKLIARLTAPFAGPTEPRSVMRPS